MMNSQHQNLHSSARSSMVWMRNPGSPLLKVSASGMCIQVCAFPHLHLQSACTVTKAHSVTHYLHTRSDLLLFSHRAVLCCVKRRLLGLAPSHQHGHTDCCKVTASHKLHTSNWDTGGHQRAAPELQAFKNTGGLSEQLAINGANSARECFRQYYCCLLFIRVSLISSESDARQASA